MYFSWSIYGLSRQVFLYDGRKLKTRFYDAGRRLTRIYPAISGERTHDQIGLLDQTGWVNAKISQLLHAAYIAKLYRNPRSFRKTRASDGDSQEDRLSNESTKLNDANCDEPPRVVNQLTFERVSSACIFANYK